MISNTVELFTCGLIFKIPVSKKLFGILKRSNPQIKINVFTQKDVMDFISFCR